MKKLQNNLKSLFLIVLIFVSYHLQAIEVHSQHIIQSDTNYIFRFEIENIFSSTMLEIKGLFREHFKHSENINRYQALKQLIAHKQKKGSKRVAEC